LRASEEFGNIQNERGRDGSTRHDWSK